MENNIRIVLLTVGVLVILAILWDGVRRQRKNKQVNKNTNQPSQQLHKTQELREILELDNKPELQNEFKEGLKQKPESLDECKESLEQEFAGVDEPSETESNLEQEAKSLDEPDELQENSGVETFNSFPSGQNSELESVEAAQETTTSDVVSQSKAFDPVIIFTVIAPGEKLFGGFSLLQALLKNHFRFGDGNIFHYHKNDDPYDEKWFSLAAATETGEFELSNMANFSCKGLVIFMNSKEAGDEVGEIFEEMVETTEKLAKELNAELRIGQTATWDEGQLKTIYQDLLNNREV